MPADYMGSLQRIAVRMTTEARASGVSRCYAPPYPCGYMELHYNREYGLWGLRAVRPIQIPSSRYVSAFGIPSDTKAHWDDYWLWWGWFDSQWEIVEPGGGALVKVL